MESSSLIQGATGLSGDIRVEALRVSPYRLPLKQPWKTATGLIAERHGFLISLRTEQGLTGYGDCAPLIESGTETLAQAEASLGVLCNSSSACTLISLVEQVSEVRGHPATRNAIETAVLDVVSQAAASPLHRCLSKESTSVVAVNASVGTLDADVLQRCQGAVDAGYRVLKIKVGIDSINKEINYINNIIDNIHENIFLRLDANRSWSGRDAEEVILALHDLPIESLEEPLREPSRKSLQALQDIAAWPIAIDESVVQWTRSALVSDSPVKRVICKPAVIGGLAETLQMARELTVSGTEVVITTTLESAAGTWACAHLAAALNNELAHGLATSEWFAKNAGKPPIVHAGKIDIPSTPGLGFVPFEED